MERYLEMGLIELNNELLYNYCQQSLSPDRKRKTGADRSIKLAIKVLINS